jgi:hypothetical protein
MADRFPKKARGLTQKQRLDLAKAKLKSFLYNDNEFQWIISAIAEVDLTVGPAATLTPEELDDWFENATMKKVDALYYATLSNVMTKVISDVLNEQRHFPDWSKEPNKVQVEELN